MPAAIFKSIAAGSFGAGGSAAACKLVGGFMKWIDLRSAPLFFLQPNRLEKCLSSLMNDQTTDSGPVSDPGLPPMTPAESAAPTPPAKRKLRWWAYVLMGLGGLVLLGLVAVIGVVLYYHSLIKNYTSTQAISYLAAQNVKDTQSQLISRWATFTDRLKNGKSAPAFKLSEDDLNAFLAYNKEARDHVRIAVTNGRVVGYFSMPLDKGNQKKELKGRFLNGEATLNVLFQDGLLTVSIADIKANQKPIPRWLLKIVKSRSQNLAKDLDNNADSMMLLQKLDDIKVEGDGLVLTPSL